MSKYYEIGEKFQHEGKDIVVEVGDRCILEEKICAFMNVEECSKVATCCASGRKDKTNVIFIEQK